MALAPGASVRQQATDRRAERIVVLLNFFQRHTAGAVPA